MKDTFFESEEFKENLKKWEDAVASGSSIYLESDVLTDIAEYYHSKEKNEESIRVNDYALNLFPGATAPLLFRSRWTLLIEKDVEKSTEYLEKVDDKTDLEYYYMKAEILIFQGKEKEADQYLEENIENISQEDKEDYFIDVAELFCDYECWKYTSKWLAYSSKKNDTDYREVEASTAIGKGEWQKGENILNQLLDENPYDSTYWNQLAASQFAHNNISDAIKSSEYAIAINPNDYEAIMNKANGLMQLYNYEEAEKYYRRFVSLRPSEEAGELFLGIALMNEGKLEESFTHLQKALENATEDSINRGEILKQIGFGLSKLNRLDEAMQYLNEAEKFAINKNEINLIKGHINLEHNKLDEAEKYFNIALQKSHHPTTTLIHIGISYFDNQQYHTAYEKFLASKAQADDDWANGYPYLALCAWKLQDKNFFEYTDKAVEHNPEITKALFQELFPEEMTLEDMLEYMRKHFNNKI